MGVLLVGFLAAISGVSGQPTPNQRSSDQRSSDRQSDATGPTRAEAERAMHRAVDFFRRRASAGGGYVYQLSDDLTKREGEGRVGPTTAWIQPPATPSVGMAYLTAFELTGDRLLLEAAVEVAEALIRGQLRSGGWDNMIEFADADRKRYAYRVDNKSDADAKGKRNTTTFDDDKTQSSIRFLVRLDQATGFGNRSIHEAALFSLDAVLKSQYPNGAWPQRFSDFPDPADHPARAAMLPQSYSKEFPGKKYAGFYTLNDNTCGDLIVTLLDAWEVYQDERYRLAAEKGGEFFLLAQLPEPQPGWAQQYDREMRPAWARKFEPPAVTGGESQGVMRTLIQLYRRTAKHSENAERFLKPIPRAIAYYRRSLLPDGRLARFYEVATNRPLYFTKDYRLTYEPDDLPTHYSFVVGSRLDRIESELLRVKTTPIDELWRPQQTKPPAATAKLARQVRRVIDDLDHRGAWVEDGRLRYHDADDPTRRVIRSETFSGNLRTLAGWIAANP